ncbi:hypothetical protein BC962_1930 [Gillisia mitskevichiae]|uniref:Phosphate-selective porin O/P n=1 Tax=Gillisia mitskevichiae TaxID=270921 RepID=A0A495PUL3_9FLAO|nr:hypothetical protein [Gillisia mitskevichiae]RKS53676.1 hypothetical protein BC962_1930 [Gillisia mitskevichiae]
MKNSIKYFVLLLLAVFGLQMQAQEKSFFKSSLFDRDFDNYRNPDQRGLNDFEPIKDTLTSFDGINVRVGGAFALQFQDIDQENSGNEATPVLQDVGGNFNLATANLDFDVMLYDGVQLHLRTYLSSQHHTETYVKGGYLQIDKLDFISEGFAKGLMDHMRIKIGHMENNYGDAHFRRSDNAMALYNPFVGNYLMDSFTTEVGAEVYYFNNGFLAMVGATNGKLNQAVTNPETTSPSLLAKVGYDDYVTEDLRFRLTGSVYHTAQTASAYLYSGDRAGSRYYNLMTTAEGAGDGFRSARVNPGLRNELTSIMINPFLKYGGLEFFGIYERASGKNANETDERVWNQYAGELLYRFGTDEKLYVGGRYNYVDGELASGEDVSIDRFNVGAGWFMTRNILAKVEYVTQNYYDYPVTDIHNDGQFNGFVFEAVISF